MQKHFVTAALLACALVIANPSTAAAQGQIVEAGLRYWKPSPEIVLSTGGLTALGLGDVDFVNEFGFEDERFRELRATIGRGHKFRLRKVTFEYNEETTIQRTIVFQGRPLTVGTQATGDVKWDLWTFGYEWDFISRSGGFLGFVTDLKYNKVTASIESPMLTSAATTDVTAPVPTIGVIGRANLGTYGSITSEFTGLSLKRGTDSDDPFEGKFYDFDIYGTINLGRNAGIEVGYRSIDVHYLVDDDSGDLKMKGPYFGGVVKF
ncbi:MAG: hypothetical protein HOP16_08000 [Acidobacteria bacterium]|nr:hypothetical protein [Acidobacteriota bacterium]